jgi:hypothetical protein
MKNQYFGDINDYCKYGLLRILSETGLKIGITWMLTEDDRTQEGGKIGYLDDLTYRRYDPELFDKLHQVVYTDNHRHIDQVNQKSILRSAAQFSDYLTDDHTSRTGYFKNMLRQLAHADLIFFDPDNGLEVKSTQYGHKNSSKYLYWCEVKQTFAAGHSLLLFQHFPRENHANYMLKRRQEILCHIGSADIYTFSTSSVVYFLASQPTHADRIEKAVKEIEQRWNPLIKVVPHLEQDC